MNRLVVLFPIGLSLACSRQPRHREPVEPVVPVPVPSFERKSQPLEPIVLVKLPISAYATALALDNDAAYLMTPNAAYHLVAGQQPQVIELELGNGPVLAGDAFVYWHDGAIWRTPKMGGQSRAIAELSHQPQYFVTAAENLAWVDRRDNGLYTIQSLDGREPHVLVKSDGELSALNMIGNTIFFVRNAADNSWRIGKVQVTGGDVEYAAPRHGPTPSLLTGTEHIIYWDLDSSEIRMLPPDLKREETWLQGFVCSPSYESGNIYCGCVEGLFEVRAARHEPNVLSYGRHETITFIRASSKHVVWTVDEGPNQLAVNMLPVQR